MVIGFTPATCELPPPFDLPLVLLGALLNVLLVGEQSPLAAETKPFVGVLLSRP